MLLEAYFKKCFFGLELLINSNPDVGCCRLGQICRWSELTSPQYVGISGDEGINGLASKDFCWNHNSMKVGGGFTKRCYFFLLRTPDEIA